MIEKKSDVLISNYVLLQYSTFPCLFLSPCEGTVLLQLKATN